MLGVLLVIWSGLTAAFGLYLQSKCARYLERGTASFFALSQITYSQASVVFDAAIAIKCFGVGVSYMIIIGDLMPGVMLGFSRRADHIPYLVDRHFWITAFMLLVIPLSFLRRLDSLKYTSLVALVSIGYLIVLVIYHFAVDPHADPGNIRVVKWAGAVETLSALPIVVFAYTCHQNMFSIVNEIKDNTPSSVTRVIVSSIGSAASIYIVVAITGYITFGNDIVGNIVLMYPTGVASTIGKTAIVILVLFSIPLQVHPCRASLDAVLKWRPSRSQLSNGRTSSSASTAATVLRGDHSTIPMSDTRFALLTTLILTLAYFTALSVSSLDRVLAFVGSTGSTSISFILPGLFYYRISHPESSHHQRLMKEDDDMEDSAPSDIEDSAPLVESGARALGDMSQPSNRSPWRWRRKWRWDLEHLDHGLVRKLALALSVYGVVVMVVCLFMNIFFAASH
ncbi:Amino acid transporter, transmembrane [Metarhizium album ARSEF 1941]|uniref:Amino acid transporter, transmembrane n=1 Tax=Metarhizium album (strain ARSEF 1941) TaxID=1081103 RepID=A0A0B2X4D4_METAS|nr:Amino acid transporter, transmembrane [Metarhizium album ARSEF 1941]KHO00265.1 Amino acid transporter, transmembrane [Metarhizium album ARSEF 1941]